MEDDNNYTAPALYDNIPDLSPDSQKVVLFNCCNEELSPSSDVPGIRIVGFFHDKEEAQRKVRRIEKILDQDELVDFYISPVFEPFLICRNQSRMTNGKYRYDKVNYIVNIRNQFLDARKQEFEEHKEYVYDPLTEKERKDTSATLKNPFREKPMPKGKPGAKKKTTTRQKAVEAARKKKQQQDMMREYPRELEIRDQEFAAISWLKDVSNKALKGQDAQEPVIYIYRCFATEDEALTWIQEVAMKEIDDPPVEIVRMYGWLHPTKVDYSKVPELYANQGLNDYMQALNKEQKETRSFESWCLEKNIPIPTVSIETLAKGDYKKPEMDVQFFEKKDSLIPDEEAVYVEVQPLSKQTKDWEKLEPKPKPPRSETSSRVIGKTIVPNKKL